MVCPGTTPAQFGELIGIRDHAYSLFHDGTPVPTRFEPTGPDGSTFGGAAAAAIRVAAARAPTASARITANSFLPAFTSRFS